MPLLCAYLGSLKHKNNMHYSEICAHTFMNSGPWCCLLNQFGYFSTEYSQKIIHSVLRITTREDRFSAFIYLIFLLSGL